MQATPTPAPAPQPTPAQCVLAAVQADPAPAAEALGVTRQQVLNLAQLAAYLRRAYPAAGSTASFSMDDFYDSVARFTRPKVARQLELAGVSADEGAYAALVNKLQPNECGTVACAAGHGPAAGVPLLAGEGWGDYLRRCYTGNDFSGAMRMGYTALFCGSWTAYDNTPRGAAARICYALQHGWQPLLPDSTGLNPGPSLYAEYVA